MPCFVALTKLIRKKNDEYQFHFRGVFKGQNIRGIKILGKTLMEFELGEEYLLYLKFLKVEDAYLVGEIVENSEKIVLM